MSDNVLWCCHLQGPDDVYATADRESAVKMADKVNAWTANIPFHPDNPTIHAEPAVWHLSAEAHAEALARQAPQD